MRLFIVIGFKVQLDKLKLTALGRRDRPSISNRQAFILGGKLLTQLCATHGVTHYKKRPGAYFGIPLQWDSTERAMTMLDFSNFESRLQEAVVVLEEFQLALTDYGVLPRAVPLHLIIEDRAQRRTPRKTKKKKKKGRKRS